MSPAEREDLLFLYAAGALEGDERDEVEAWLARVDTEKSTALARAEAEVAELAGALQPLAPSPAVRERLLRRIGAQAAGRRAAGRGRSRVALAAGIAAVVALGVGAALGRGAAERASATRVDAVRAEVEGLDEELAEQEAAARSLESELVLARKAIGVLRADATESLALAGTASRPDARGRVFWDWDEWYCYLHVAGLARDPARVYALWLATDTGELLGVGTFEPDASGEATFLGPVPHDIGHVVRISVSLEPDADLGPKPRGEVVMTGGAS
jgi:anti-sigma-K factor RskA